MKKNKKVKIDRD